MSLKKKLVIVGLSLVAFAPAIAQAAQAPNATDAGLFEKPQFYCYDFHLNRSGATTLCSPTLSNGAKDSGYDSDLQSFFATDPSNPGKACLASAADVMKREVESIQQTQAYVAAMKNLQSRCGITGVPSNLHFQASGAFGTELIKPNTKPAQPSDRVLFSFSIKVDGKTSTTLMISKRNPKSRAVVYDVNENDTSCSSLGTAVSDLNIASISNQVVSALQTYANSCATQVNQKKALTDLTGKSQNAVSDFLGDGIAPSGSASAASQDDGVVQAGCWNACPSSAGAVH